MREEQATSSSAECHRRPEPGAWIVGVDGSECSDHALRWAVEHSRGRATALHLVTSWLEPRYGPYPPVAAMTSPYDSDAIRANAQRLVDDASARLASDVDIPVETIAIHGSASAALIDTSAHGALLVVGNRGRGGFRRLLLGSTSTQCATHAAVPTVVVPPEGPVIAADRITVGVDGSPNSLAALRWALDFADDDAIITVVSAWDTTPLVVGTDQFFFPDAAELAEERFERHLDTVVAESERGVHVVPHFVRAEPRSALGDAAREADLVVIGARGHGMIGAALLGSVSTWMLHHLDVPIAVIPGVSVDDDDHDNDHNNDDDG